MRRTRVILILVALAGAAFGALTVALARRTTTRSSSPPLVRNDEITWYLHRALIRPPWFSFRVGSNFVTFSTEKPVPTRERLLEGLDDPDTFVASHLLLVIGSGPMLKPGTYEADTEHRSMGIRLESHVTLDDQPDGSCIATVDGLRVRLRRTRSVGSYLGKGRTTHTIYAAKVEVEPGQQAFIRERWLGKTAK